MSDTPDRRHDLIQYVNAHLHDYVKQADLKAIASMTFAVVMLTLNLALTGYEPMTKTTSDGLSVMLVALSYLLLLGGFGAGILVIFPRIVRNPPQGWIFWESITGYDLEAFLQSLEAATSENIRKALATDSYFVSKILTQKFFWLRVSVYVGSMGAILSIATIILKT